MAAIFVMAVVALVRRAMHREIHGITTCSRILLYPSVAMMGIGIFLERYGPTSRGQPLVVGPQETWALIAFLVCGGMHRGSLKSMRGRCLLQCLYDIHVPDIADDLSRRKLLSERHAQPCITNNESPRLKRRTVLMHDDSMARTSQALKRFLLLTDQFIYVY